MKPSGVGGMAVMEGVMMKNKDQYAVAVRKPDNEIAVEISTHKDFSDKVKLFKLPIFRGMMAFVDSMVVGVKVLNYSASFFEEEEETEAQKEKDKKKKAKKAKKIDDDFEMEELSTGKSETVTAAETDALDIKAEDDKKDEKSNALLMLFAVLFSIVLSVSLFMVLPILITNLFSSFVTNKFVISFIEGIIRLAVFIGYVFLASRMQEIKRVFMYHGAEHKTINCLENGFELTVENVRWQSKEHKRCGTSFMLLVILISLVFFMVVPVSGLLWKILSRVLLVPFIAGVSYEFIRLAGRSESKLVNVLSKPGLWMQGLTTKEPDDSMIEVAIQSVSAVFDWRAFLENSKEQSNEFQKAAASKELNRGNEKKTDNRKDVSKKASEKKESEKKLPEKNASEKKSSEKNISEKPTTGKSVTAKSNDQKIDQKTDLKKSTDKKVEEKKPTAVETKDAALKFNKQQAATQVDKTSNAASGHKDVGNRNPGIAPVNFKPVARRQEEEEDDEILNALDKFFDNRQQDLGKVAED